MQLLLKMLWRASLIWLNAAQTASMLWQKSRHECRAALCTIITLKTHQGSIVVIMYLINSSKLFLNCIPQIFVGIKDLFVNVSHVQWLSDVWLCNLLELSWSLICLNSCKNGIIVSPIQISNGWRKTPLAGKTTNSWPWILQDKQVSTSGSCMLSSSFESSTATSVVTLVIMTYNDGRPWLFQCSVVWIHPC